MITKVIPVTHPHFNPGLSSVVIGQSEVLLWSDTITSFESVMLGPLMFAESEAGSLLCYRDPPVEPPRDWCNWEMNCKHTDLIIKQNQDRYTLWQHFPGDAEINVPLIQSMGSRTTVTVTSPRERWEKDGRAELGISGFEFPKEETLGWIRRGEGRQVIREVIFSWFYDFIDRARLTDTPLICQDSGHTMNAQMKWQAETEDRRPNNAVRFEQYWSVYSSGQCLGCRFNDDEFAAFIPKAEPPRFKPF